MAQKKYTDGSGVSEIWLNIKNYVYSQLLSFVDLTSTQTISGLKTFTSTPVVKKNSAGDLLLLRDSSINSSNEDSNGLPLSGHTNALKILANSNNIIPCMLTGQLFTNGNTSAELRTYKYKDITSSNCKAVLALKYLYTSNKGVLNLSNADFQPTSTNILDIGSLVYQWKNIYAKNFFVDGVPLATIATSGSYNDLADKPTIPSPYTPPTFTYDSSTETLSVSNTTATVFNYDAQTETLEIQVNG